MQSRDFFSEEDLRLFSPPPFPVQSHQSQKCEWSLDTPSDADLDDEVHLSAMLKAEDQRNKRLHRPEHASSMPLPTSSSDPFAPDTSVSPAAMFLASFSPAIKPAPLPDDEGQTIAGYTLGSIIGYGGNSIIRRAFSESGGVVAVKIVRRSELDKQGNPTLARKKLQREAEVWSSLSHEHILPLFTAVHTSYADFFVTIYCPAGSMYDILKRDGTPALPQDDAGMMFRQVVRGLRYLHEVAMYVHRDIKLENVLVDEMGVCKIGDFGMARKIGELDDDDILESESDDPFSPGNVPIHRAATLAVPPSRRQGRSSLQPTSMIARHSAARHRSSTSSAIPSTTYHAVQPGSLPYAAPEILLPQTNGPLRPHPAQDIWALGILLYALLTGRFPFNDLFEPRLQMKILHGTFDLPSGIGKGAERVLLGCLERNSGQRWSIAMVDEVAWGIGWGSEGDDVTPAESDEEFETHCRESTHPHSRSHSRPPTLPGSVHTPLNQEDGPYADDGSTKARLALEAASRRSVSRAQRSQSRAPMPTHLHHLGSNFSRGVSRSRHPSRAPSPSPSSMLSPLASSIESPFLASPTSSYDRGRRPRRKAQFAMSRSPSPSVVPRTPADFGAPFSVFRNPLPVVDDQPDEFRLDGGNMNVNMGIHARLDDNEEVKRGRSKSTRERAPVHARTHRPLALLGKGIDPDDDSIDNIGLRRWNGGLERSTSNEDADDSCLFRCIPNKERSRSCGYGHGYRLGSPTSRSPSSSRSPSVRSRYQAPTLYESAYEGNLKGRRTGSIPSMPVSPSSPRLTSVAGTPQATDLPSATSVLKELLKSSQGEGGVDDSSADMAALKSVAGKNRGADYGVLGWT